jgi:hypothetical protein
VVAREPDLIIGSWCGKKFRPERVVARGFHGLCRREERVCLVCKEERPMDTTANTFTKGGSEGPLAAAQSRARPMHGEATSGLVKRYSCPGRHPGYPRGCWSLPLERSSWGRNVPCIGRSHR